MKRKKQVTMTVTVSVPKWLTAAQARKEVASLIRHQAFWGHQPPPSAPAGSEEISEYSLKLVSTAPVKR